MHIIAVHNKCLLHSQSFILVTCYS